MVGCISRLMALLIELHCNFCLQDKSVFAWGIELPSQVRTPPEKKTVRVCRSLCLSTCLRVNKLNRGRLAVEDRNLG